MLSFTCKSINVIHVITCKTCQKQYVAETLQTLNKRMNGHRSSVKNASSSTFLYEHYNITD